MTLAGQSVLITGGTGAFGSAYARHALEAGASRVAIFARSESKLAAFAAAGPDPRLRLFVGDVRDRHRLITACRGVQVVVHAAALKRVEICEADPAEAIATNITGTQHVAAACLANGVPRAVFLSTDKAVSPNTLYGATKLAAERFWVQSNVYAAGTPTRLVAVRYGNVLGSTGSVLESWRAQFAAGIPLSLTDASMTRFWMRMAHAVATVDYALWHAQAGEIIVPNIGAAPILELARAIVEVRGTYAPGHTESGMRPGEKRHETLIGREESRHAVRGQYYHRILPESASWQHTAGTSSGEEWEFTSAAQTLTVAQLREMIA